MPTSTPPLPQRPTIPAALLADTSKTITVPLHLCPLYGASADTPNVVTPGITGYKLGIQVQLTCNGVKSQPDLYEFDTGGQGFWASPTGIPKPAAADCTLAIEYASGIVYEAAPTVATITFTEANATLQTEATIGLVGTIKKDKFPIFGYFAGDFGAALQGFSPTSVASPTPTNTPPALFTALAQLQGNYGTGFIVDTGAYPDQLTQVTPPPGRLIVGLTDDLRKRFPNTVPMSKYLMYTSPSSGTSYQTYFEDIITGNLTIGSNPTVPAGIVFDTGAPATEVHAGSVVKAAYAPTKGDPLVLTPQTSSAYSILNFIVGDQAGLNKAQMSQGDVLNITDGYINTGLNAFFQYPIMFDLANGVVGFPNP